MNPTRKRNNENPTFTDLFCGAGGSTWGAKGAGMEGVLAMNHWELAIETHNLNNPEMDHSCADIRIVDPRYYPSTRVLLASPECTNHSLAKGKKRNFNGTKELFGHLKKDAPAIKSRATMWDVPGFAEYHKYDVVVVENVVDARRWTMWEPWLAAMSCLGYHHEVVYYNSMFAPPTPQSRDRMYVVFWHKRLRKPNLDFRPPGYCSKCEANVDTIQSWKNQDKQWGKYGIKNGQYVYRCATCSQVVVPYYFSAFNAIDWSVPAVRIGDRKRPLKEKTLARIRYGLDKYGRNPIVVTTSYTTGVSFRSKDSVTDPLSTQPGHNLFALADPGMLLKMYGGNRSQLPLQENPLGSVTCADSHAVLGFSPALIELGHGQSGERRISDPFGPLPTATTRQTVGITTHPLLVRTDYFSNNAVRSATTQPGATQTQDGKYALVMDGAFMADMYGSSKARGFEREMICVTASGGNHALVSTNAFMAYYYGTINMSGMADPVNTVTTKDRAMFIEPGSQVEVDDCTFRMLQPHEIKAGMAFDPKYEILGTKRLQVNQLGNAVTPPVMQMICERIMEIL